jgi:hypothetical protein
MPNALTKEGFEERKKSDNIKNVFCENEGIRMVRIPYNLKGDIEKFLENILCSI